MSIAAEVVAALVARGETLATCESLTGGLVGAEVTSVPGSSAVYVGGFVTYDPRLKHALVNVSQEIISEGVVTRSCARAMAQGAREVCASDWALSTTGVAGPGPQEAIPAGTVWVGLTGPGIEREELLHLRGDRAAVRAGTVEAALRLLGAALAAHTDRGAL